MNHGKIVTVVTKDGEFETETNWNLETLAKNLNYSGLCEDKDCINIGDYVFRKADIIMVKPKDK